MLAREAPAGELEGLLDAARRAAVDPVELARMEQATQLGLCVLALFGHRQKREADLAALVDTARDLTFPHGLDSLLRVIIRQARRLLGFDMAYISLLDDDGGWSIRTSEGETTALNVGLRVEPGYGFGDAVTTKNAAFWTADYLKDERIQHSERIDDVVRAEGQRAILAVPLHRGGAPFGALYGSDRTVRHFTPDEVGLMRTLADLAAVAIDKSSVLDQAHADVNDLEHDSYRAQLSLTRVRGLVDTHSKLIGLALGGSDLTAITVAAGHALDGTLVVRDPGGRTLTATGELPGVDEPTVAEAVLDAHARRRPVGLSNGIWIVPLDASGENLGALFLRPAAELTPEDEQMLQLAAQAVTMVMLLQRSTVIAEGPVRDELLDDLLADPPRPQHQLADRARRLGIDLDEPHVVVVARPEGGEQGRAGVWASSYAHRMGGLKGVRAGCVMLMLPGSDASDGAWRVSAELSPLLGHPVSVAASGPGYGPAAMARVYREAMRTLDALTLLRGIGATAATSDLGFLGLLLSDDHDIDGFVASAIGPVLDYDAQRLTELTKTLQAYFDSDRSPTYAAEALHVHPNTVSRRLERITELLGPDWQKPQQALEVQLALKLQRTRRALEVRRPDGAHRHGGGQGG
ncbi:helix-turn-helix domain-containing protein [Streptomyces sp. NBC_01142]|uniref:helix-turn-helix domain-containing protein n=1 Tax=Streptomyces sp. NBC_01142 TaxID=2975865 RepID=UPI00224E38CD|nr:GAF domain-containing protein [Streptomyces sp. NBC_01142]MCX4824941.1 helix-turn-helix domain-containing protein [Streptomyces sp. NBC_01142]